MHPLLHRLQEHVLGAWRYRWAGLAVAALVALAGWAYIFHIPDQYNAYASVVVDTRTLRPALQGLTAETDIGSQLDFVQQTLLVDSHLCQIANKAGMLEGCAANPDAYQGALAGLRHSISLEVHGANGGDYQPGDPNLQFAVTYSNPSRETARTLVQVLLDTLQERALSGKQQGSENAQAFLTQQLQDAQNQLRQSEDKLAAFRARHAGNLPSDNGGYAGQLDKENQAASEAQTRLVAAQNRRAALVDQLHTIAATATAPAVVQAGGMAMDTASQIAAEQAHLDDLLLRFTDKHPDVIAARAQLAQLKARRKLEIQAAQSGDANAVSASGVAANPVYQSTQIAINQADVDIASIRAELGEHQSRVAKLHELLTADPQIESEYGDLTRADEADKGRVAQLQASYDKSRLGEQAAKAGDVRFRIVQPPTASSQPVTPHRDPLLALVLVLGLVAGGAATYGLDQLHPVVGTSDVLEKLAGAPVLVSVGSAFPARDRARRRGEVRSMGLAVFALVCALGVALAASHLGVRL